MSFGMNVLDPESLTVIRWERFMVIVGILSIIHDPFILYVPDAKGYECSGVDVQAAIYFTIVRTSLDLLHLLNIILKFRRAVQGQGPRVFSRTKSLIKDPHVIAINYLKSRFVVDVMAIVPFPQMLMWSESSYIRGLSPSVVMIQFGPRMISLALGFTRGNIWSGAIYNLFIFILIGHFLGAMYYTIYLERLQQCLYSNVRTQLNTTRHMGFNCSQVHEICVTTKKDIEQGMLSDAFTNKIGSRSFAQKVIYCFVWGVRSLSSLGQIFEVSYHVKETIFSCAVIIIGLILLADLIARMQTSVQSAGARREEQMIKKRKLEEWTHYQHLPHNLKGLVRQSVQTEWQGTNGLDDEGILNSLPLDLRRDIRHHLYKERLCNVPPFSRMDDQLLDFVCGHLRTYTGAEGTYILLQGDPLEKMYFIFRGLLQLTHHHRSGHANSRVVEVGDFFGEELLPWATQPNSPNQGIPLSTYTVKCITNVEAFVFQLKISGFYLSLTMLRDSSMP